MNPISEKFPLLSFVISRLNSDETPQLSPKSYDHITATFPQLLEPKVIASLLEALPVDIVSNHFMLNSLPPRPDPEIVASARLKLVQIEDESPEGEKLRELVTLDKMHEECTAKLSEAEEKLAEVYKSATSVEEDVNEEVVKILSQAESGSGVVERVELADRQLRFLPEAFGKLQGLVSLNLAHNQLEVSSFF